MGDKGNLMFVIGFVIMLIVAINWPSGPDDKDQDKKGKHRK